MFNRYLFSRGLNRYLFFSFVMRGARTSLARFLWASHTVLRQVKGLQRRYDGKDAAGLYSFRQYVVTPQMYKRGFTCIMVSVKQTSNRDYRIQREVTTHE